MIIDSHTHIGAKTVVGSTEDLIASMKMGGIDKAMVFAGVISGTPTETLLGKIEPYKGKLFAVGSFIPTMPDKPTPGQIESLLASGAIRGLKFYPGYEYYYPYDEALRPYLALLAKYRRPVIFHSGDTFSGVHESKLKFAHPLHIDELATEMPDLPIVIAHLGYPWVIDAGEVCYKNKNVYADCSGFVYGKFDAKNAADFTVAAKEFMRVAGGSQKILFGSDWPISDQRSYAATAKNVFGAKAKRIFSENAIELFGLF